MKTDIKSFRPRKELRKKYQIIAILVETTVALFLAGLFVLIIYTDPEIDDKYGPPIMQTIGISYVIVLIIVDWGVRKYYETISFEILEDEIHVNRGLITKSRKIVPYRTITNLDIKRGPFDKIFGIGTLEVQTAGYSSASTGPEERLDGILAGDLPEIQAYILGRVRRITGSPGTSHSTDLPPEVNILNAILEEIKELRKNITERKKRN